MKGTFVKFFGFLVFVFIVAFPFSSQAASLYIDPANSSLFKGDSVTVAVRLDTDELAGECVNAVDGVLSYSQGIEPVDISIGKSIFNVWVEPPTINKNERTVTFAGGIPNGYCGRVSGDPRLTNILAEIVFRSPGFTIGGGDNINNTAVVSFSSETTAYLNDGQGTKAPLNTYPATIKLSQSVGTKLLNPWQNEVESDTFPPEKFSLSLQKGDGNFSNKYYIVFSTTDKQTGIDHYEIMEEPLAEFASFQWGRADAPWIVGRSPYVLKDQSLNATIRVKAVDKAGNQYIANLIPDESMRTYPGQNILTVIIVVAGIFLLSVIIFAVSRFRKTRRKLAVVKEGEEAIDDNNHLDKLSEEQKTD